jgi:hypothetical protein
LLDELTDETVMFSGHGKPWTVGEAKLWWQEIAVMPPVHKNFSDEVV